jgi:hypothetical protein
MWQRFERIFKADAPNDDDTDDATYAAALHFLYSPHGAGVLRRTGAASTADIEHLARLIAREWRAYARASADAEHDSQPWTDVIGEADTHKGTAPMDSPVVTICKAFCEAGRSFMSENELSSLIEQYALADRRDGETEAQAFSRVFSANSSEGMLFRKAVSLCKLVGPTPFPGDDDGSDAERAYKKLTKLGDRERARDPSLSEAQAFAKVFRDNPELAAKAVRV